MNDWENIHVQIIELYSIEEREGRSSRWKQKEEIILHKCYKLLTIRGKYLTRKWSFLKDDQRLADYVDDCILLIKDVIEKTRRNDPPYDPQKKPIEAFLSNDFNRLIPLEMCKKLDTPISQEELDDINKQRRDIGFFPDHFEENINPRKMSFEEVAVCFPGIAQYALDSWGLKNIKNKEFEELEGGDRGGKQEWNHVWGKEEWKEQGDEQINGLKKILSSSDRCYIKRVAFAKGERGMLDQELFKQFASSKYSSGVYARRALWKCDCD